MTRLGECLGLEMAKSRLMRCEDQIRFLSRYFLEDDESLAHGAEIVKGYLEDEEFVEDVERQRLEKEIFTFQVLRDAISTRFPENSQAILRDFVRMIGFDALVGNQDRHLFNWGVIVHPEARRPARYSPIYDTARGLFWNYSEEGLTKFETDDALRKYVNAARPLIGCDGEAEAEVNHFRLVAKVAACDSHFEETLRLLGSSGSLPKMNRVIGEEFARLFSPARRHLIGRCLELRFEIYQNALGGESQQ